jgi:hypothetical protein
VESDSLIRFQVYASLAYGAQGIWYFTYRDGLQKGAGYPTDAEVRKNLLPTWQVAAEANHRVAAWGPHLLGRSAAGIFHTGWSAPHAATPAEGKLIEGMSEDLLVGLLTKPGKLPLAMVVDKRVDKRPGTIPDREVELRFARAVASIRVLDGSEERAVGGNVIRLRLPGGGGQLLALRGRGLEKLLGEDESRPRPRARGSVGRDGLLLHVKFDEGEGQAASDSSGLENHVRLYGIQWCDGKLGKAISLEGKGNFARSWDALLPATDAMTIAAWVRPKYPEKGYAPVVHVGSGGYDRFEFGFGPDNLYPVISDGESHSGGTLYVGGMKKLIPEGTWGHIAVCAGPKGAATYVNGRPVARTDYVGRFDFVTKDVYIGTRRAIEEYDGAIDDLRIWNRCLTAEEVQALAGQ